MTLETHEALDNLMRILRDDEVQLSSAHDMIIESTIALVERIGYGEGLNAGIKIFKENV